MYKSTDGCIRVSSHPWYDGQKREKGAKKLPCVYNRNVSEAVPERGADKAGGRFTALEIGLKFSTLIMMAESA